MNENNFEYTIFSRRAGTMENLISHRSDLIALVTKLFPRQSVDDTIESIDYGIGEAFAAVILAFVSSSPIGVMTMYQTVRRMDEYGVGVSFVEKKYRRKGVWRTMSAMAETEAIKSGAHILVRKTVPLLIPSLIRQGYKPDDTSALIKKL